MIKGIESILIGSQNAKKLADFYKKKVGLKLTFEGEMGDKGDDLFGFDMKGTSLYIIDHSKVKGKNQGADRMIFNIEVSEIKKEVQRLDRAGVKKIQDTYHVQDYGYIATFEDLDGNYFQFVQVKAD